MYVRKIGAEEKKKKPQVFCNIPRGKQLWFELSGNSASREKDKFKE